jgi:hypothetical protein
LFLLDTFVTGVAAGYCLLAIWVACGRGHWFARACVLLAALALLVPIRAYEPLILFGMTSVTLVGGWGAVRWLRASEPARDEAKSTVGTRWRFRLADLLLMCVVAGGISWLVSEVIGRNPVISYWRCTMAALMLAVLSSLAVAAVHARRRWISIPLLILGTGGAAKLDHALLNDFLYTDEFLWIARNGGFSPDQLGLLYSLFAGWILLAAVGSFLWNHAFRQTLLRKSVRALIVVALAPCILVAASVYWHMVGEPSPPADPIAAENNLPRILALSRQLTAAQPGEAPAIYAELLPLLKRPAAVTVEWSRLGRDPANELDLAEIQTMRAAARQMDAECQRLRMAGRHDEAADFALAILRLGDAYRRGGLVIHFLVGEAITGVGQRCLAQCRADLTRDKALEAAKLLESIAASGEPLDQLLARDAVWMDRTYTWRQRLSEAVQFQIWGQTPPDDMRRTLPDVIDRVACQSDLLIIDLALRAYKADHGKLPARLDDLAPQYLDRIPSDRFSGRALVYRPAEKEFVLYSVGKGGRDDGGKFSSSMYYMKTGYDFDVDTMLRP